MIRLYLIAILSVLIANSAYTQQNSVDTLYTGLNKAISFTFGNDAIYIVEAGAHRVLKLGFDGKLIERYGKRGSGNYQFDNPLDIATTNGLKLFVSDKGNNRIQVFDKRWQYLSSIKGNDKFRTREEISPEYIGVNKQGEIFFYDSRSKSIGKYDEDGAYLDQIPIPSDIKEVSGLQISESKIFILDKKSELIHRLSENGFYESFYKAENGKAFFYLNGSLFLSSNDVIYEFDRQKAEKLLKLEDGIKIIDLLVIEDEFYILTENYLLKIISK